jgi:hypothetical protein
MQITVYRAETENDYGLTEMRYYVMGEMERGVLRFLCEEEGDDWESFLIDYLFNCVGELRWEWVGEFVTT